MVNQQKTEAELFVRLDRLEQVQDELLDRGELVPLALIEEICEVLGLLEDAVKIEL